MKEASFWGFECWAITKIYLKTLGSNPCLFLRTTFEQGRPLPLLLTFIPYLFGCQLQWAQGKNCSHFSGKNFAIFGKFIRVYRRERMWDTFFWKNNNVNVGASKDVPCFEASKHVLEHASFRMQILCTYLLMSKGTSKTGEFGVIWLTLKCDLCYLSLKQSFHSPCMTSGHPVWKILGAAIIAVVLIIIIPPTHPQNFPLAPPWDRCHF